MGEAEATNESQGFDFEVPVLVVGAGPAGLAATLLLQRLGVKALTVTRYGWTANSPRAHYQNQRAMEIWRELGLDGAVAAEGLPHEFMRYFVWTSSLAGTEFARLPMFQFIRRDDYIKASPSLSCNIAQHVMEPVLARAAMDRGARISWNRDFLNLSQDATGVTARVLDRLTGKESRIRAQYVIGTDGARSRVATAAGITHSGIAGWASAVNVWFRGDLSKYCAYRPGLIYAVNQPGADYWIGSGMFVVVEGWNEWMWSFMYDEKSGAPDLSEAALTKRVREAVGDEALDVEILAANTWQMNAQVADTMSVQRVFIAGDAAHRHPPLNGLGANTSVQDSYNLAWKLKLVLDGKAGAGLLDSYDLERRPVAQQVIDRSMESVKTHGAMAEAIGFTGAQTEAEGWQAYASLSEPTEAGKTKRANLQAALALQQFEFGTHGVEVGVRYGEGAMIGEPGSLESRDSWRDRQLVYEPTSAPGAHLPHAWLERDRQAVATIDLAGGDCFALIVGHGGDAWKKAADAVSAELGVGIVTASIGVGLTYMDVTGAWNKLREIEDSGCLLVRPDQVVAWRSIRMPDDPHKDLRSALMQILDLKSVTN